jgi:hypothetical protein
MRKKPRKSKSRKSAKTPWEKAGMSRSPWYRHGKPKKRPPGPIPVSTKAKRAGTTKRTYQRLVRVFSNPEIAAHVTVGRITAAQADRLLADPDALRQFLEKHQPAARAAE